MRARARFRCLAGLAFLSALSAVPATADENGPNVVESRLVWERVSR